MSNQDDYYDLQDYPETPVSEEVLIDLERMMAHRPAGTLTIAEVVTTIIDYVVNMDPFIRVELRREHTAMMAHHQGVGHTADYVRLKADLRRSSETTRWMLDRMCDDANTQD